MPLDDYVFISEINSGAISKVYKCRDCDTGEERAIKLLDMTVYGDKLFDKEIQMLTRFQYLRGVIKMYEFGRYIDEDSDHLMGFIVLELCDQDLRDKPLESEKEKLHLVSFLLRTLYLIHQDGYALCDLKLENILRKGCGFRLCDFATCQPIGVPSNSIVGTDCILAPEIILALKNRQPAVYTEKVDIWCMGCVIYEIYSKEPPFNNYNVNDSPAILYRNILALPPRLELIQEQSVRRFIQYALVKNPQQRATLLQLGNLIK